MSDTPPPFFPILGGVNRGNKGEKTKIYRLIAHKFKMKSALTKMSGIINKSIWPSDF